MVCCFVTILPLTFRILGESFPSSADKRFVRDSVISKQECKAILDIAKMFALPGDGYGKGNITPHTKMEKFEGFSMSRGGLLVYFGLMEPNLMKSYIGITDLVKKTVEKYFGLQKLYFTYTHLVCRSALPKSSPLRNDLSHSIHSDNCNIQQNGECKREPPAYTWRDYSAILYLNDEFAGGEFIFTSDIDAHVIEQKIAPTCGRLVAFSSGKENLHGVNAVRSGSRCAVGIWFTLDEDYRETDRDIVVELLKKYS